MTARRDLRAGDASAVVIDRRAKDGHEAGLPPRLDRLGSVAPFILLGTALALLVLLPMVGHWYAQPLQDEMRNVAEPGRGLVTRMHVAIALQGAALRDYLETRSLGARRRYREASLTERAVSAELAPLVERLGTDVKRRFADLHALEERWHEAADPLLTADSDAPVRPAAPEELYEELLIAAARLDESIEAAIQDRRARIIEAESLQQRLLLAVGVVALLAVALVAWLGRHLRAVATTAELGQRELQRANTSRERLMRGIGHDLRNPLNAIDGHAQLLEDGIKGELSPGQHDSVVRIRRAVRTLLTLVDDLVELSRAEAGQLRLSIQPVDMKQLVFDTAAEHHAAAESRGHRLSVAVADDVSVVHTDPHRVSQVLGNLVSNAIKYTPPGGEILLRADTRPAHLPGRDEEGGWLAIDVMDSGSGIPPHRMEEIFGEFTRLDHGSPQPGAGLGLAIARRIARLLGGDVVVANGEKQGAVFTLVLPPDRSSPLTGVSAGNGVPLAGASLHLSADRPHGW